MVHKMNGVVKRFRDSEIGLYYLGTTKEKHVATTLINTVEDNKSKYINADYIKALVARTTQKIIGRPSPRTYLQLETQPLVQECLRRPICPRV